MVGWGNGARQGGVSWAAGGCLDAATMATVMTPGCTKVSSSSSSHCPSSSGSNHASQAATEQQLLLPPCPPANGSRSGNQAAAPQPPTRSPRNTRMMAHTPVLALRYPIVAAAAASAGRGSGWNGCAT